MAWWIERASSCPECGTRLEEWDPKTGGHRQAYTVKSWSCPGCRMSEEVYSSTTRDNPDLRGIKVRLEPTQFHPYYAPRLKKTLSGR